MARRPLELPDNVPDCHTVIRRQADRIDELEARVDQLLARVDELVSVPKKVSGTVFWFAVGKELCAALLSWVLETSGIA